MFGLSRTSYAAIAIATGAFLSTPSVAKDAVVKSNDGTITMAVEVLSFDEEKIRVLSELGEYTLDLDLVSCEGLGCPPPKQDRPRAAGADATVTLTSNVGSNQLTGELIEFTGAEYVVSTTTGEHRLRADVVTCAGAACPQLALAPEKPSTANADEGSRPDEAAVPVVTLTSKVGGVEITGELLEFSGSEYVLLTPTGEFRLGVGAVECSGAACPNEAAKPAAEPVEVAGVVEEQPRREPVEDPMVTLTTVVGAIEISGELLGFNGTEYIVLTPTGEYRMRADRVTCSGAACPASEEPAAKPTVTAAVDRPRQSLGRPQQSLDAAPDVTLTTNVGAIEITGKLLEFTGTEYVLFTPTGEYRMQAAIVSCSGAGCPGPAAQPASVAAPTQTAAPVFAAFDPARADVRISGADAVGVGLLPSLWQGYADWLGLEHELLQVSETESASRFIDGSGRPRETHYVASADATQPFAALIDRSAEFAMAARAPNQREAAQLRAAGGEDPMNPENNTVVAIESIAVIVHPDNRVDALSLDQIARIYRGEISNWAEVGGENAPIQPLSRNDRSGTREVFEQVVAGGAARWEGPRTVYQDGGDSGMRRAVLASRNSIGYVAFASADGVKRLNLSSSCGLTSVATPFSVKTEEYPLVRRHYLFSRPDNLSFEGRKFLEYMRSPASEGSVAASDLVNFSLEIEPASVAEDRYDFVRNARYRRAERALARDLEEDLLTWERLSTTLRFATGSSRLGTKELADVQRLIAYLGQQPDGAEVAVVGFADSVGDFAANLRLSNRRAALVAQAIEAEAAGALEGVSLTTKAFSELAPAACNTDANGRRINRRVEIWIRRPS